MITGTDIGSEHVERPRPFVEAGLPVFVDKPLVDNEADLATFMAWVDDGKPILLKCFRRGGGCWKTAKPVAIPHYSSCPKRFSVVPAFPDGLFDVPFQARNVGDFHLFGIPLDAVTQPDG